MPDKQILIYAGDPAQYGYGHINRCTTLLNELNKRKAAASIVLCREKVSLQKDDCDVIIDARDIEVEGSSFRSCILLDHQGDVFPSSALKIDTLPNLTHNSKQLQQAMSFFISQSDFRRIRFRPLCANLRLKKNKRVFPNQNKLNYKQFQQQLFKKKIGITGYFGQTLFEVLQMGKSFSLAPLTDYHWQLSVLLFQELRKNKKALSLLDGKGAERLVDFILSAQEQP